MLSTRLLIVSNRLPVTAGVVEGRVTLTPASGGLATGLRPWHEASEGLWIGWPGDVSRFGAQQRAELNRQLAERAIVPVHLSRDQIERFYHGFANRVVWPLFHYLIDRVPIDAMGWDAYKQVNQIFADIVTREYRAGDTVWVHDYQLMLLPGLIRDRIPGARIGFFLHTPFPSSEVFRILPWRNEILHGLLGSDLIGFHTFSYMRHFLAALRRVEGVEADIDLVRMRDHEVKLGVFPMGVDAAGFAELATDPAVVAEVEALKHDADGRQIVLGIDRLDYTKGIPRRLHAVEQLFEREPSLRDRIRYIQVAVPSRGEVDSYQRFKRQVEEIVGRINGAYGTLRSTPLHYMHQSVSKAQLVGLYRAADVMLITALRDGMNLVAKEFVASRVDEDGVLVLSEFAGAAAELDGAIVVNPYDVHAVAGAIQQGLEMPAEDRRARMRTLRRRVSEQDIHAWAGGFLAQLGVMRPMVRAEIPALPAPPLDRALAHAREAGRMRVLLDYDGTLVALERSPELAAPDPALLGLLAQLAAAPGIQVDIVSGRPRETLEAWLGGLPLSLWAEHGLWHRSGPDDPWHATARVDPDWIARLRPVLDQFTASTPGSHVEIKSASVAWHYRTAPREFGARQALELRLLLSAALANQPFEVLEGNRVIEVRLRGVSKATAAHRIRAEASEDTAVIAIGDDRTDDDLFGALPASSITIAVGHRPTRSRFHVDDHHAVRQILRLLMGEATEAVPAV